VGPTYHHSQEAHVFTDNLYKPLVKMGLIFNDGLYDGPFFIEVSYNKPLVKNITNDFTKNRR
jgi:hypothetical protein